MSDSRSNPTDNSPSVPAETGEKVPPIIKQFRVISGVSSASTWLLSEDADVGEFLTRVVFLDQNNEPLLDSTLKWDDLIFVSRALLSIVGSDVEKAIKVKEKIKINLDHEEAKKFAALLQGLEKQASTLQKFFAAL